MKTMYYYLNFNIFLDFIFFNIVKFIFGTNFLLLFCNFVNKIIMFQKLLQF